MAIDSGLPARQRAQGLLPSVDASLRAPLIAIAILTLLRFVLGAVLPLSFDEAYYWLWSKHLAAGYYDHPPAIAYAIRIGTAVFGDTAFGIRVVPLLLSVLASAAVWRSGMLILEDKAAAARACLYFNLTLMVAVESMAATPDAMALTASALVLAALAELVASDDGRWWLATGAAGGLCLLSKYTGFFLGAGVLFWLLATARGRRWLVTPWPYVACVLALAVFAPVIAWNADHDWISFRFQFGRVTSGGFTLRYVGEFVLAQAALASPFLLVLGGAGFVRASRFGAAATRLMLPAALIWPSAVYFFVHALHDRVQGNWPSFVYPAFALLAAFAVGESWNGALSRPVLTWCRRLAVPFAALILALVYAQAFFAVVPARDPIARLTAFGMAPVTEAVTRAIRDDDARAVVTTSYATTAWLAFYLKRAVPVVQVDEDYRWLAAPEADAALARGRLLYVTQTPKALPQIARHFAHLRLLARVPRKRRGALIETYDIYDVSGWRGGSLGRVP